MLLDAIANAVQCSDALVKSVSGAGKLKAKGQRLQRNGVQRNDTKGAC